MKFIWVLFIFIAYPVMAEVKWDIPIEKFGEMTGKIYLMNLTVGDKAEIDEYSSFCTTKNNVLAISSVTEVGSGSYRVILLPGKKISLQVPNERDFLKKIISNESYASCSWWTAHRGKYILIIDNVNGKKNISSLDENHDK